MTKITSKKPAAKPNKSIAAKAETNAAKKTDPKATTTAPAASTEVATINPNALMVDVGPAAVLAMIKLEKDEAHVKELAEAVQYHRDEQTAKVAFALWQAGKNDPKAVDLAAATFAEGKGRNKALEILDRVLGVKIVENGEIKYNPAIAKYMPPKSPSKEYKETAQFAKQTYTRNNFVKMMKRAAETAEGFLQSGAVPEYDAEKHTLRVTNAPKQIAGPSGSITLSGGKAVEGATMRPSMASFAQLAREKAGKANKSVKTNETQNVAQKALESEDSFGVLCNSLITVLNSLEGNASEAQTKWLLKVNEAIVSLLDAEE